MTISLDGSRLVLRGECPVEEAETLLDMLHAAPALTVDVSEVRHLHAAVLQVLLALRPRIEGEASDEFVKRWIVPAVLHRSDAVKRNPPDDSAGVPV